MVFTALESSGCAITSTPWISWTTNVPTRASRNTTSCSVPARTWRRRISDSSAAVTNTSPTAATTSAAGPILCPGISASSDTVSALINAVSAPAARTRWICAPASASASRPAVTEMATNSSPISAPATLPLARKKSWMLSGTTRRSSQPEISGSAPAKPSGAQLTLAAPALQQLPRRDHGGTLRMYLRPFASLPALCEVVEEGCDVAAEQAGYLGGREVAATGHGCPPADVVEAFGPFSRRGAVVDELVKDGYRGGHRNHVGEAQFVCQASVVDVVAYGGRDRLGGPVQGHHGEQEVTGEGGVDVPAGVGPASPFLQHPGSQAGW